MKAGTIVENARVTDTGVKGKHIAKSDSGVILVDNAIPGDIVDIRIRTRKKGVPEGSAVKFHEISEYRVKTFCSHFEYCGGCSWQNISYEHQLQFKEKLVTDALRRIGKVDTSGSNKIIPSRDIKGYRNRLDFAFSNKRWLEPEELGTVVNGPGLGFHIPAMFDKVLDIKQCYLQPEPSNKIRDTVRDFSLKNEYPFFDIKKQEGSLRSLIIRTSTTGDLMVIVVFFKENRDRINKLMEFIKSEFPEISSLYYVLNPKGNDTLYDLEHVLYSGNEFIHEKINEISYRLGPKSFFQTNPRQAEVLINKAVELGEFKDNEVVFDLYTGVGSIALQLALKCKKVVGIETVPEAIEYAKLNATINGIENVEFFASDVKYLLKEAFIIHGIPDVIVVDPPRVGMDKTVVNDILESGVKKIVYVSCNPATQARDIELLSGKYKVTAIQPVDMFPHTYHVENISVLNLI